MKTILFLCCCAVLSAGVYHYATYERENQIDYAGIASIELHAVRCMDDIGNLETYHIPIPEYSGFSQNVEKELLESYAEGFCNSI